MGAKVTIDALRAQASSARNGDAHRQDLLLFIAAIVEWMKVPSSIASLPSIGTLCGMYTVHILYHSHPAMWPLFMVMTARCSLRRRGPDAPTLTARCRPSCPLRPS